MASSTAIALAGTLGALGLLLGPRSLSAHPADTAPAARAPAPDDEVLAPPPTFQAGGVTVDERVGNRIPLDARFRTQDGAVVTLGEVIAGDLPVILTFNYSDCPMLCSVQLNGLTAALPAVGARGPSPDPSRGETQFRVGAQVRIVTIDLEPNDTIDKVQKMRERYLARLPEDQRATARAGWTFLLAAVPSDGTQVQRVADAVGFRYTYLRDRAEWAHPAALILLSAAGVVTRYVYGVEFEPAMLRDSIYKAGLAEPSAAAGFMIRCYHYDPGANNHARAGVTALQVGAAGFLVLFVAAMGRMRRRSKRLPPPAPNGVT